MSTSHDRPPLRDTDTLLETEYVMSLNNAALLEERVELHVEMGFALRAAEMGLTILPGTTRYRWSDEEVEEVDDETLQMTGRVYRQRVLRAECVARAEVGESTLNLYPDGE